MEFDHLLQILSFSWYKLLLYCQLFLLLFFFCLSISWWPFCVDLANQANAFVSVYRIWFIGAYMLVEFLVVWIVSNRVLILVTQLVMVYYCAQQPNMEWYPFRLKSMNGSRKHGAQKSANTTNNNNKTCYIQNGQDSFGCYIINMTQYNPIRSV